MLFLNFLHFATLTTVNNQQISINKSDVQNYSKNVAVEVNAPQTHFDSYYHMSFSSSDTYENLSDNYHSQTQILNLSQNFSYQQPFSNFITTVPNPSTKLHSYQHNRRHSRNVVSISDKSSNSSYDFPHGNHNSSIPSQIHHVSMSQKPSIESNSKKSMFYGIFCVTGNNYENIFTKDNNDIIFINYHFCEKNIFFDSNKSEIQSDLNSVISYSCANKCYQVWFNKFYIQELANLRQKENIVRFKVRLYKFLGKNLFPFGILDHRNLQSLIDGATEILKYNKMIVDLFLTSLVFRIRNLKKKCAFSNNDGYTYNLFDPYCDKIICIRTSIFFTLQWWASLKFSENNLEENIYKIFDVVFRRFFVAGQAKQNLEDFLKAYLFHIINSFTE
ncbi:hypothetical protein H312_03546 [Anncaliia algerae PRA339]|uniref:Uncharacterized protein n=1 Tax=Anncaliia algerae PRA339 TaxID=1288291 RepID=A0A059EWK1_9MICR|nr:hypothetical protein H312_03546 [Anncaliia algerae PRA339]